MYTAVTAATPREEGRSTVRRFLIVVLMLLLSLAAPPSTSQLQRGLAQAAPGERRVALVVGNDNYLHVTKLERAVNDAKAVGAELEKLGFEVLAFSNLDRRGMNQALTQFVTKISAGGVGVFFFAGHGVQVSGSNYLLPTDINVVQSEELQDEAIDLGRVMERLSQAKAKFSILILDACRDNPFPKVANRSVGGTRGLTIPSAPEGLMVVYSAGVNEQAIDRLSAEDSNPNGLFTRELLRHLGEPNVRIDEMVKSVRLAVREQAAAIGQSQNPAIYDQSSGDFYFVRTESAPAVQPSAAESGATEIAFWDSIKNSASADDYRAYLRRYPAGNFAELAKVRVKSLETRSSADIKPPASALATGTYNAEVYLGGNIYKQVWKLTVGDGRVKGLVIEENGVPRYQDTLEGSIDKQTVNLNRKFLVLILPMTQVYVGTIKGNTIEGTWRSVGIPGSGTWTLFLTKQAAE
jgi:uncharacterized caspase-like protein